MVLGGQCGAGIEPGSAGTKASNPVPAPWQQLLKPFAHCDFNVFTQQNCMAWHYQTFFFFRKIPFLLVYALYYQSLHSNFSFVFHEDCLSFETGLQGKEFLIHLGKQTLVRHSWDLEVLSRSLGMTPRGAVEVDVGNVQTVVKGQAWRWCVSADPTEENKDSELSVHLGCGRKEGHIRGVHGSLSHRSWCSELGQPFPSDHLKLVQFPRLLCISYVSIAILKRGEKGEGRERRETERKRGGPARSH